MSGGIQQFVTTQPAPGIVGDFCDANPRYSVDAGPGGLVAGISGLVIGRFAWGSYYGVDGDGAPAFVNNTGSGPVLGFVGRAQQALITTYLSSAGVTIPAGFQTTVFSSGGFWVVNSGTTQALPGQKVYAKFADGTATAAASGSAATAVFTAAVAASTLSVTGSIAGNVLTVAAIGSGTVVPGATLSGTNVATGTKVVAQLSGTTGGIGTYAVSIPEQTVVSTTISGTYGTMTVSAVSSGAIGVGDALTSGTGVVVGTVVTALGTGTGGTGTYIVDNNTVVASAAITAATSVETSWYVRSSALAGELMKISNLPGIG
ncbi:MAG TPA: hypothetical protein VGC14_02585 [Rhizobium sp.]